jgi:hypothetical protein
MGNQRSKEADHQVDHALAIDIGKVVLHCALHVGAEVCEDAAHRPLTLAREVSLERLRSTHA